jgi:predicted GIY-YIG superfamily endonuclease
MTKPSPSGSVKQNAPQILYRFWNADNKLLYVGISQSFLSRMDQHQRTKTWFVEIVNITFEHFATRAEVEAAELRAIKLENPRHNRIGKPDYVPMDHHIVSIVTGSVYKVARFKGRHEWIKPYIARYKSNAQKIADKRLSRSWLVFKAYSDAKKDGYFCLSCETVYTSDAVKRRIARCAKFFKTK